MLAVVIPTHSRPDSLRRALASIGDTPVVVVDDSLEGLESVEGVPFLRTGGEEGFASAANRGLEYWQERGAERVLLVNDDVELIEGCIEELAAAWVEKDGALAPVLHEPGGPVYGIEIGWGGRVFLRRTPGPVKALSGAVLLMRSTERFDSGYRHGFEDIALCCQLRERGLRVRVVDSADALHAAGASVPRQSRLAQRRAISGHLRWVGGGPRGLYAVALSVAQIIRERGPMDRIIGVVEGVRDHLNGAENASSELVDSGD
jgi:GT2 family glycosyltransferase